MITLEDIANIIADTFLNGSLELAGIILFMGMVIATLWIAKDVFYALVVGMGATFLFTMMGILSTNIAILMIVVCALGLAFTARSIWGDYR